MGEEAPEVALNGLEEISLPLHDSKSGGSQTATSVGDKTFVVEGIDDEVTLNVKIFDQSTRSWLVPRVLGDKPAQCKGHLAVVWSNERILIVKKDALLGDCIWFLEVDTPFVREQKKSLGVEVVAWSKGVIGDAPKPIVISGPSGVGKGTLIAKLMEEFPSTFGFSVSHTTRAPREKEVDGVHYHFSQRSSMEKDIRDGKFLEFASVHGNLYGTSIEAVEAVTDSGKRCILDIDVQGARSVRASSLEAIFIFICPPSFEELEKRLRARGTETEEQVLKRLRNAKAELDQANSPGLFNHILVNDDLQACFENLKKLIASDGSTDASRQHQPCIKDCKVPVYDVFAAQNQKVIFHCNSNGLVPNSFVLDMSFCKGGAPGRTRGLGVYAVESLDHLNGVKEF